ncbi:hypothetical protein HK096_010572, partial [Nowakowskiella sp. JEL0078]
MTFPNQLNDLHHPRPAMPKEQVQQIFRPPTFPSYPMQPDYQDSYPIPNYQHISNNNRNLHFAQGFLQQGLINGQVEKKQPVMISYPPRPVSEFLPFNPVDPKNYVRIPDSSYTV